MIPTKLKYGEYASLTRLTNNTFNALTNKQRNLPDTAVLYIIGQILNLEIILRLLSAELIADVSSILISTDRKMS
jgi:hypothetical protein